MQQKIFTSKYFLYFVSTIFFCYPIKLRISLTIIYYYTEGPFLISCMVDDKQVYWTVNKQYQLMGTTIIQQASPFYVIPTEQNHPCEFFVVYYGESKDARKQPRSLRDPVIKYSKQASLPRYLSSNANMFGYSDQPLKLISSATAEATRFCLNEKIIASTLMCFSTAVSPESWIDGDEFFINCSRRILRIDGYLAIKRKLIPAERGQLDSIYASVILPTVSSDMINKGMLFRLQPAEHREMQAIQESEPAGEGSESTLDAEAETSFTVLQDTPS